MICSDMSVVSQALQSMNLKEASCEDIHQYWESPITQVIVSKPFLGWGRREEGRKLPWGLSISQEDLDEQCGVGEAPSHRALGRRLGTCGPLVICVYLSVWCVWEEGAGQPEVGESKPFEDRPSFWNGSGVPLLAPCPTVVCILLSPSSFACALFTHFTCSNTDL